MSVYGTSLGVALPAVADTVNWPGPDYAEQILLVLEAVIERLESKVTPAGIQAAAWNLGGYAVSKLVAAQFSDLSADPSGALVTYFKGNEWYLKDGDSTVIKVTQSGVLNVGAVIGVTGSGYGAGGVAIEWDGSAERYRFKSGSGADAYADLEAFNVDLYEADATNYVRIKPDPGSATYNFTFPAALPAGLGQVMVDSTGQVSVATAPKHDNLSLLLPFGWLTNGDNVAPDSAQGYAALRFTPGGTTHRHIVVLPLRAGDQIQSLTFYGRGSNSGIVEMSLREIDYTDGTAPRWIDRITGSASQVGSDAAFTFGASTGAPYTLIDGRTYAIVVEQDSTQSSGDVRPFGCKVVYNRP